MTETPNLLQTEWRESTRVVNDVSLHIVEAGQVGDPLLILLHGFPEFWWAWRHQMTAFANAGFHFIAPDQRGYNLSDAPAGLAAYTLDILVRYVLGLADTNEAKSFYLAGHDWGAVVGWRLAATHPSRLIRVVLMDGPLRTRCCAKSCDIQGKRSAARMLLSFSFHGCRRLP